MLTLEIVDATTTNVSLRGENELCTSAIEKRYFHRVRRYTEMALCGVATGISRPRAPLPVREGKSQRVDGPPGAVRPMRKGGLSMTARFHDRSGLVSCQLFSGVRTNRLATMDHRGARWPSRIQRVAHKHQRPRAHRWSRGCAWIGVVQRRSNRAASRDAHRHGVGRLGRQLTWACRRTELRRVDRKPSRDSVGPQREFPPWRVAWRQDSFGHAINDIHLYVASRRRRVTRHITPTWATSQRSSTCISSSLGRRPKVALGTSTTRRRSSGKSSSQRGLRAP